MVPSDYRRLYPTENVESSLEHTVSRNSKRQVETLKTENVPTKIYIYIYFWLWSFPINPILTLKQNATLPRLHRQRSQSCSEPEQSVPHSCVLHIYSLTHISAENVTQEQPRRGPKEHFNGSRKIYLQSRLPAYIASKKGSRQKFWHALYSGWWERFPWKLGDDKEPPTNDPAEMTRLASIAPGEEAWKEQVETRLKRVS